MRSRGIVFSVCLLGLSLVYLLVACGGGGEEPPAPPPGGVEGPAALGGEDLLEARCTKCHNLDRVKAASKPLDEWTATVERMRGKGAELSGAEAEILSEYLAETYGP